MLQQGIRPPAATNRTAAHVHFLGLGKRIKESLRLGQPDRLSSVEMATQLVCIVDA